MLHKNVTAGDNHIAWNWQYANATARTSATGFVAADVGKFAWQTDNNTIWILTATTPAWASISATVASLATISDWPAGVDATEVGYLNGVTGGIQGQLDNKAATGHSHSGVYEPANANIQSHISNTSNPHSVTAAQVGALATSLKGAANGVAELDGSGKVPTAQLPSYVDDVLEYANLAAFPGTGSAGVIYVAIDTGYIYRWSGSVYTQITGGAGVTNLSYTASTRVLASDTGSDATLPLMTDTDAGLAPASGGGASNYLRADGTWASPTSGAINPTSVGATTPGSGAFTTLTSVTSTDGITNFAVQNTNTGSSASGGLRMSNSAGLVGYITGTGVNFTVDGIRGPSKIIVGCVTTEGVAFWNFSGVASFMWGAGSNTHMVLNSDGKLGLGTTDISNAKFIVRAAADKNWAVETDGTIWSRNDLKNSTVDQPYAALSHVFKVGSAGTTLALTLGSSGAITAHGGVFETRVAMAANDVNLQSGTYFTKTISGATALTVSNVPSSGTVAAFVLDLTNGGSSTITWWANLKWAGGTAPTLTAAGRDVLSFYTHDAGATWSGFVVGKDVK